MTENEQNRARDIFADAIELAGDERVAFLESACSENPKLKERVDRLIQAHDADLTNLGNTRDTLPDGGDLAGTQFGRFRMLQKIGEGGFGEVWMAEQTESVRRRVAIKIIKPGMDSAQVLARFDAERQALALMEHPNIARIYDGGETEDGRPFFVMELVKGLPITEYCARNKLDLAERIALIQQVCSGVQHAHQKGVIHRDIKPSNVLVGVLDGKPVPKVIDFGIAKALERPLTDKTLFTEFRQFVGTPEYMSPEQADLSLIDVDTRSDVYALGVMLYELLVGAPPFDPGKLRSAGFDEMRRIIREEDPPVPSVKLSQSRTGSGVNMFDEDDARMSKLVRGELDWIVQRAMAKERDRRYPSANELEEDLERYVNGEAVRASPPRRLYRVSRFVRRNRVAVFSALSGVAALLVISILLAVGLVVLSANYERLAEARASELDANERLQESLVTKTNALEELEAAQSRTASALDEAEEARSELNLQMVSRRLRRAAELSVDAQPQAVAELDGIPAEDANWLSRMLRASLPSTEFSAGDPELPFYEEIIEDSWVLQISRDATRAVCMRLDETSILIELVRLDVEPRNASIKELYSVPRHPSIKSVDQLETIFQQLRRGDQDFFAPVGFTTDGSRVVLSPGLNTWLLIASSGVLDRSSGEPELEFLDWFTRVFSTETGELLCAIDTSRDASLENQSFFAQIANVFNRFGWASSSDGSRLAVVSDGVLAIHDVDAGNRVAIIELDMESTEDPVIAMSPSGRHVAVIGGKVTPVDQKLNLLDLPSSNGSGSEAVELSVAAWPGDGGDEVESLAFMHDEMLYGVDSSSTLWGMALHIDMQPYVVGPLGLGPSLGDRGRRLLEPIESGFVPLMNGRHFTLVDVNRSVVSARIDLGLGFVSMAEAPDASTSGSINVWTQTKFDRKRLGSSVARAVTDGASTVDAINEVSGWAPSLVVGSREIGFAFSFTVDEIDQQQVEEIPEEDRPKRVVVRDDSPPESKPMKIRTPFGSCELDDSDIVSVSPDGRFLLIFEARDGSHDHGMEIFDSKRGVRYPVDGLQVPGGYRTYSWSAPSHHCWVEIDGTPALVASGMKMRPPEGYFVATWNALDGTMIEESNLSGFLDADLIAEMGVDLPSSIEEPWAHFMQGAVSPDGRYYALSGIVIDRRNFVKELERMRRVTSGTSMKVCSIVMIVERATGEIIEQHVLQGAAGRVAFSPDGAAVATILSSDLLAGGLSTVIALLPNPDVETADQVVRTMGVPGLSLDGQGVFIDMGRSQMGQVLSFSPDGALLTCALKRSVDLFSVKSASHLMRIDGSRLERMLGPEPDTNPAGLVAHSITQSMPDFAGAGFSPDGTELRINAGLYGVRVAMFRIFDHPLEAAE